MKNFLWLFMAWLLVRFDGRMLDSHPFVWWQWILGLLITVIAFEIYPQGFDREA